MKATTLTSLPESSLSAPHLDTAAPAPAAVPASTAGPAAFAQLGLVPELLKALAAEGYTEPTPIQKQAIPSVLEGRDLLGIAQTGTGKTAAFALPILQRLMADRKPATRKVCRALILSPTRELATQIGESFKAYGRHTGLTTGVIFGGVGYKPQINLLTRGVDVLVATPGRLIDLMNEGHLSLGSTEILVLDEADQMMDLGFIRPLRQIVAKLSHKRQSLFFSATMPHEIGSLAAELLRDPVQVSVTPVSKTADRVSQRVIHVETAKKRSLMVELLADDSFARVLVFTRTKRGADKVARHLETAGIVSAAIHGNKSQNQREIALDGFKRGKVRVLVATDIAARGIDVDNVTHVINYELPNVPESYVHRIGRTARAGCEGIAISLVDGEERAYLRDIERLTRQQIPAEDRRNDASLAAAVNTPSSEGGRSGSGRGPGRDGGNHRRGVPGARRDGAEARREGGRDMRPAGGRGAPRDGSQASSRDGQDRRDGGFRNGHGRPEGRGERPQYAGGSGHGGQRREGGNDFRREGSNGPRQAQPGNGPARREGGSDQRRDGGNARPYDPLNAGTGHENFRRDEGRRDDNRRNDARRDDRRGGDRDARGPAQRTRSRFDEARDAYAANGRGGNRPASRPASRGDAPRRSRPE